MFNHAYSLSNMDLSYIFLVLFASQTIHLDSNSREGVFLWVKSDTPHIAADLDRSWPMDPPVYCTLRTPENTPSLQ
jgi:hypothetical protein